jgi:hypothetical protein
MRGTKGVGFGYGTKSDFTKDEHKTPAPTSYEKSSFIEVNRNRKKGFSIGGSREKSPCQGIVPVDPLKNPGVGAYDVEMIAKNERQKAGWSLKKRFYDNCRMLTS